jgi:hypothetical protein
MMLGPGALYREWSLAVAGRVLTVGWPAVRGWAGQDNVEFWNFVEG